MANRAIKGRSVQGYDNSGQVSYDTDPNLRNRPPSLSSISTTKSDAPITSGNDDSVGLKKKVGLMSGTALIVGTMIGSGIFISPKGVVEGSGSVGLSLVNWVVCGLISTMGALGYAELGTLIPESGAEIAYYKKAYGSVPTFLFSWVSIVMLRPSSMAIIALTCAEYVMIPFFEDGCPPPDLNIKLTAAIVICESFFHPVVQESFTSIRNLWILLEAFKYIGALSYAELGTMILKSGGEYTYLLDTFQPLNRHVGSIPAFLFAWMNTLLLRPASIAIIVLAFSTYTLSPFYELCDSSIAAEKCLAAFIILLLMLINCLSVRVATAIQVIFTIAKIAALAVIILGGFVMLGQVIITAINIYSVKLATQIQIVFTFAKIFALILIICGGAYMLITGHTQYLATGFEGTESNVGKIAIGLYNGMWAYDGWNNLNYVTEEIVNPYVNLPRSIMIGIPLVTVLYLLVNISYFTVLSVTELLASPAVAITWGRRVLGVAWPLIPIFVAFSTFGAANGTFFTAGRLTYVAAREGHMAELLSMVHVKRFTPLPSLVFTCIISLIMIIPGDIASLIDFFSFAVWMFYGGTMLSLIVLRFTMKDAPRPYKVPIILPIIVLIVSIYLVFAPIIDNPQIEFLYAFLFILAGLIFYVPFVHYKVRLPGLSAFTLFMQLFMECSPATGEATRESTI